jgi:hypothetical protein
MFDGSQDAGAPLPDMGGDFGEKKSFFQKIFSKSETIIPVILIVILLLILVLAFSGWDYSSIPVIGGALQGVFGSKQYNVLVIGKPKPIVMDHILGSYDFTKKYRFQLATEDSFASNPEARLKPYDFIILDQSDADTPMGMQKAIPYQLGEALKNYVASGKSILIVGNSGHRLAGNPDAFGWKAIFGSIVPVDCIENIDMISPCVNPTPVTGIFRNTMISNIFEGIDEIPSLTDRQSGKPGLDMTVYPVNHNGEEWMYIKDIKTNKQFAGIIVNKSMLGGKVVYFSFEEWGQIPNVIHRVFEYIQ